MDKKLPYPIPIVKKSLYLISIVVTIVAFIMINLKYGLFTGIGIAFQLVKALIFIFVISGRTELWEKSKLKSVFIVVFLIVIYFSLYPMFHLVKIDAFYDLINTLGLGYLSSEFTKLLKKK